MVIVKVKSSNGKDVWEVDLTNLTCTCPDYRYRKAKTKSFCKHIQKAIEHVTNEKIDYIKVIENNDDPVAFVEKYGEDVLSRLKLQGEVFEAKGKLHIIK